MMEEGGGRKVEVYMLYILLSLIYTHTHTHTHTQKQAQRVYEILRLRCTDRSNTEQYTRYRLAVKNRLNGPYQARPLMDYIANADRG